ncbi:YLP motif-containing protein 1-like [Lolium rigidum]|uniref:YLP motif-containing protein 1-like n=1 Tax=Lolium rigidum TaxID=89674 RepID=UPI001F5C6D7C|nr:YLP motif-containing protein 1-like [Lolium rigidum]
MDHPWRFPAGDLCPVCAAPHFPFCPPPPPLPPHPFPYDLHPPPPPPPPQYHAPFHPPPPPPMWAPPGPHPYDLLDMEGPHKRMRVGDAPPFDPYAAPTPPMPGRASVEGGRLLGLIREHGHGRPQLPPTQWHGEPYPPDGFGYGGDRGYPPPPPQNYNNPYAQGGNFADYDLVRRMPPPPPMPFDRHSAFDSGFAPVGGSQESYFDRRQFHPDAPPGAPPLPSAPQHAEAGSHYDSREWRSHAGGVAPPPPDPPVPSPPDYHAMPPPRAADSSLFPVLSSSPATTSHPPSDHTSKHQSHAMSNTNSYNGPNHNEGLGLIYRPHSEQHLGDGRLAQEKHSFSDVKVNIVNACDLLRLPLRASRPDHIVIIMRGLPGSGKSYLAKALRDLEVESGGSAPRIHSMDDYFMIEVEKVEGNEGSKSSTASKGRKQLTKKVIEYCYEPEMEETYRSSMLNAFKKTLDEGNFTFVIVDDRNLRVADFAQFWASAKRSGYEVYLLEAPYKDPTGCAARNVHGFTLDNIKKMAADWEEAPPLYLRLDTHSLFHDDNLREHSIQEVDMDTEDSDDGNDTAVSTEAEDSKKAIPESVDDVPDRGDKWDSSDEEDLDDIKELGQSKWSKDFDEDTEKSKHADGSRHALSGLAQTYGTHRKTLTWGDQLEKGGFSIGAAKRRLASSLIIGPGSGYNLVTNPLAEDNSTGVKDKVNNETKRRFCEQLRDEGQSFKAVFDKRKQRIGVFDNGNDE